MAVSTKIEDIGEYVYFTTSVTIDCSPDKLLDFLADPFNLEKWTKIFLNLRPYRGEIYKFLHDYQGQQENEECYCQLDVEKNERIIDFYWGDAPESYWGYASSRIIFYSGKCIYVFTIFRYKEKVYPKYRNNVEIIEYELDTLKSIMEAAN